MKNTKSLLLFISLICFINIGIKAQNWSETTKLVPEDRTANSYFGHSVDIYENYAVVGAQFDKLGVNTGDPSYNNCGSAYVLKKVDNNWEIIQKIVADDRSANSFFGSSVAIWGDYIIVGATGKSEAPYINLGVVYVFKNNSGVWEFKQKLIPNDPVSDCNFGCSLAIENDNLIIGAYTKKDGSNLNVGAVYTYNLVANSWVFSQKLMPSDCSAGDLFGYSIALSGDYLIAGSYAQDYNSSGGAYLTDAGAAYIFKNNSGTWTQSQKIVPDDRVENNRFGYTVNILENCAVISAAYDSRNSGGIADKNHTGSVYVFKNINDTWTQDQKIITNDRMDDDEFGNAISIYNDNLVIASAKQDYDENGENMIFNAGAIYLYKNISDSWEFSQKITANNRQSNDYFGNAIALYNNDLLVGVAQHNYDSNNDNFLTSAGAVCVFNNSAKIEVFQEGILIANGGSFDFGEVPIMGDGLTLEFKIKNSGGLNLSLSGNPVIGLVSGYDFVLSQNNIQNLLMPNEETYFTITFSPNNYGNFWAQLSIANNDILNNPYIINLQGVGGKTPQTITNFQDIEAKTYGDAEFLISANASSGLDVVFTSSDPNIATCGGSNGSTITIIGAGQCEIYANQAGNDEYNPATQISKTLTVNKKDINVSANPISKFYGNNEPELTYAFTPQLVGNDEFTGSLARIAGENIGNYNINQGTLSLSDNYNLNYTGNIFEIQKRPITVTVDAGQTKVYTSSNPSSYTYSYSGGLIGSDNFTGFLSREAGENVGEYQILQNNLALSNNYQINFISDIFTITPKEITITANSGQTKIYGLSDPTNFTYTLGEALHSGNSISGSLSRVSGEDVGEYEIQQGSLQILPNNYSINFISSNFTITPKSIMVNAHPNQSKFYGDSDPDLTYQVLGSLETGDNFTGALSREEGEELGVYPITIGSLSAGNNYSINFTSQNFEIKKKTVIVTIDPNQSKEYGEPDPVFTFTYTPEIAAWDSFSGALSRESGEFIDTYSINQGNLALNSNYTLFVMPGASFEITQRAITVTIDPNQNKIYGETDPSLTYSYSPSLVANDAFQGFIYRSPGENVGEYQIIYDNLQLSYNYNLSFEGTDNKFEILPKEITVTANEASKAYGNSDPNEFAYTSEGSLAFNDSFTGDLQREAGQNAGEYQILQGSLSISAISNYVLTYIPATFTILPRNITFKAEEGQFKTYGEENPDSYTYSITSGNVINDDVLTGQLTREAGEDAGFYEILQGSLSLGPNYNIIYIPSDFEILPRNITFKAEEGQFKTYGEEDPDFYTYSITSGDVINDDVLSGQLTRESGEDAGFYEILQGNLSLGPNYNI
ncbi:MAG: hypothetical protein M0P36_00780, partial [Bacteroidales bacterium]|nr:hypothetical protein [Bacteroidales bacterium]